MRILFYVLGLLGGIIGLVLSVLPFGSIAFIPVAAGLIFGILAWKADKKLGRSTGLAKFILILGIAGLGLSLYRVAFDKNIVEEDQEIIRNEEESLEDAKKELEDIEIDE